VDLQEPSACSSGAGAEGGEELLPKDASALAVADAHLAPALWLNLDGGSAMVALNVCVKGVRALPCG
jgi:hypothetical protein